MLIETLYSKEKRVIDIGCGEGALTKAIAVEFREIVAIDVNSKRLSRLAKSLEASGATNVKLREMDARRLEFADSSFDLAIFNRSLDHIDGYELALREAHRILMRGGGVFITLADPEADDPGIHSLFARRSIPGESPRSPRS
jgi:ubiquinone/menaquinone biosynthesis C-methylase UbiE